MEDYPSPQLSDISGQVNPSYTAFQPRIMVSCDTASLIRSPSRSGSPSPLRAPETRGPMRNAEGHYICDWSDCEDPRATFPRRCEWRKHMDKHERPYRCEMTGCDLQRGFTYSGGLTRHQKEVHGMHGGPKQIHWCEYANCSRSSGATGFKGFSRKENLDEHKRRCHLKSKAQVTEGPPEPDMMSQGPNGDPRRRRRLTEIPHESDSVKQKTIGGAHKRKRILVDGEEDRNDDDDDKDPVDWEKEAKRLRRRLEQVERLARREDAEALAST